MNENFAVFILTHGRPQKVITYKSLRHQCYTGPIFLIVDNEDNTLDEYRSLYGDQVIVFDRLAMSQVTDGGDNFNRRGVVYARNASFHIAKELGIDYFLQLDDDYQAFVHKFTSRFVFRERRVLNLDKLLSCLSFTNLFQH